jgi:hypothetical protein
MGLRVLQVNQQVSIAAEFEGLVAPTQRDSAVTVGAKFDLRMATLRAQVRHGAYPPLGRDAHCTWPCDQRGGVALKGHRTRAPSLSLCVCVQIDTSGRMAAVLEHRLQPNLALTLSGELDHVGGQGRFGVGLILQ